jgi:ABC-type phosphate transport system permease subunit
MLDTIIHSIISIPVAITLLSGVLYLATERPIFHMITVDAAYAVPSIIFGLSGIDILVRFG